MSTTPGERLALGVLVLLLAAGGAARGLRSDPPPARWLVPAEGAAAAEVPLGRLRQETDAEAERERVRSTPLAPGETLDPNTVTADDLDRLPKVGPALAKRIVEWREARGPFRTLADLDSVPGIGPALLAAAAPHLSLPPAPRATAEPPAGGPATMARAQAARPGPLDLNTATAAELETLPGVGPALASRIVAWRARHGRIRSVAEVAEVPGIGPRMLERMAPLVVAHP